LKRGDKTFGECIFGSYSGKPMMRSNRTAFVSFHSLGLGPSDFEALEVLIHKGPLPVNALGQKIRFTSGSISVAIDRQPKA